MAAAKERPSLCLGMGPLFQLHFDTKACQIYYLACGREASIVVFAFCQMEQHWKTSRPLYKITLDDMKKNYRYPSIG